MNTDRERGTLEPITFGSYGARCLKRAPIILLFICVYLCSSVVSRSQGLPIAAPQTVGMNPAKLAQIDALVAQDIKDKKLLLAFSKNKQCFYLPGGKIDTGETAKQALCREIGEELNIEPRLRPAKTGSVAQNTARPVNPRK